MKKTTPLQKIKKLRREVEVIDGGILRLITLRFKTTHDIQVIKKKLGIPLLQKKREKALLRKYSMLANRYRLPIVLIKKLYQTIFSYSKKTGIMK